MEKSTQKRKSNIDKSSLTGALMSIIDNKINSESKIGHEHSLNESKAMPHPFNGKKDELYKYLLADEVVMIYLSSKITLIRLWI